MRGDGRGETVEEALARYVIPPCLRHEKKPQWAGSLYLLPSCVYPILWGRGELSGRRFLILVFALVLWSFSAFSLWLCAFVSLCELNVVLIIPGPGLRVHAK